MMAFGVGWIEWFFLLFLDGGSTGFIAVGCDDVLCRECGATLVVIE